MLCASHHTVDWVEAHVTSFWAIKSNVVFLPDRPIFSKCTLTACTWADWLCYSTWLLLSIGGPAIFNTVQSCFVSWHKQDAVLPTSTYSSRENSEELGHVAKKCQYKLLQYCLLGYCSIVSTYTNLKLKNSVARCVKESVKRVLCVTQHMSAGLGSRVHEQHPWCVSGKQHLICRSSGQWGF